MSRIETLAEGVTLMSLDLDGSTAARAIPAPIDPVLIDVWAIKCRFDGSPHTEYRPCNGLRCDRACFRFRIGPGAVNAAVPA